MQVIFRKKGELSTYIGDAGVHFKKNDLIFEGEGGELFISKCTTNRWNWEVWEEKNTFISKILLPKSEREKTRLGEIGEFLIVNSEKIHSVVIEKGNSVINKERKIFEGDSRQFDVEVEVEHEIYSFFIYIEKNPTKIYSSFEEQINDEVGLAVALTVESKVEV